MLVLTVQSVMPWIALLPTKVISEKERCYASCTRTSSILSPRGKKFLHPIWSPSQTPKPPMTIQDAIFNPVVAAVIPFSTEEAVRIANSSR